MILFSISVNGNKYITIKTGVCQSTKMILIH